MKRAVSQRFIRYARLRYFPELEYHMTAAVATLSHLCDLGRKVLREEADALNLMATKLDLRFEKACQLMLNCKGRVVVTGMGKSGHIANKIASTLASTGTPSFFLHPAEAGHGDMGMVTPSDVVLAISNSGNTEEITNILPFIRRFEIPLIAMTGDADSILAKSANIHLDVSVPSEACPLGLAPTTSTTAALAMGDALAVALLDSRHFTANDFAISHPLGTLGRRLLYKVEDLMLTGDAIPVVQWDATLEEAVIEMSQKGLGMTAIVNAKNHVLGVFTDGDLRRAFSKGFAQTTPIEDVMTKNCKTVHPQMLAVDLIAMMEKNRINGLLVVDAETRLVGALNMHNLLRAKVL
jgi:arabinose-5-phosphate isomerase